MKIIKKLKKTIVFFLKVTLFASLFAIFFGIFSMDNPWLLDPSRTMGITMVTFTVMGMAFMSIYGGYAIGQQKSKPIIYSLTLATIITDLITHFELSIMNAGAGKHGRFVYEDPHLLLLVIILQILVIIAFTYLGNYIYFLIEPPEKCCVIASSESSLGHVIPKINRFKKQYNIVYKIHYGNRAVFDRIDECDTVFIYDIPESHRNRFIDYCYQNNKHIYYNFEMADVVAMGGKFTTIDDKSFVCHTVKEMTIEQRAVKRLMDISISLVGLIVASPIMLISAIIIKAEDGGKIFYRQKRLTKFGKVFEVLKFRTMKEENSVHKSAAQDDDRITKVGNVLRRFRLDELPQLINILWGDMTLVGPRPEMLENVAEYTSDLPEFSYRLRAKAGLTGLAQISGKYNTSPKDKLVLDLMYIENFSIWSDIKIILQTVTVFFKSSESTEAFGKQENYSFDDKCGSDAE
ncbi:sugar transferase [Scatolibacter rhodanostii]|uniref:sugar transferase n=1 Tax=Scatolibacter rhodanostii TaxID=2014781 RepID=UPI00135650D4|nr:sugar transferase [Scatolibacter rhodanostii]